MKEDFLGGSQIFWKGARGKAGGWYFFSLLIIKKGSIVFWIFFIKEDHLNYSGHPTRV